jgi:hypothetical protein
MGIRVLCAALSVLLHETHEITCTGRFQSAVWSGRAEALRAHFNGACPPPGARNVAALFDHTRIYVAGDSTFRLPAQYFLTEWLGCTSITSLPQELDDAEQSLCRATLSGNKSFLWPQRPLGDHLSITYEIFRHVENYTSAVWWRDWVVGDAYLAASPSSQILQSPSLPALATKIPDALVIGAWLWHAGYPRVRAPATMEAVLADYELQLRAFLVALVAQPSYTAYWSRGRLFWRLALMTEIPLSVFVNGSEVPLLKHRLGVVLANTVAVKVLSELAPGVRVLQQGALLRHTTDSTRFGSHSLERLLTVDGIHFRGVIQVVLMQHLLLEVLDSLAVADAAQKRESQPLRSHDNLDPQALVDGTKVSSASDKDGFISRSVRAFGATGAAGAFLLLGSLAACVAGTLWSSPVGVGVWGRTRRGMSATLF